MKDIKTLFGKKVKELRIKKKLSQEELAEAIDIAERNLSKIECGKSFIRAEKISKLADTLGVTPKDLFDFEHTLLSKDELIHLINNQLIVLDTNKLQYIYKSVQNIQEL